MESLKAQPAPPGAFLFSGTIPLPAAVLKESALAHNSAWMRSFVGAAGASIAPHVKTHMAPSLIRRQLVDGAWAVTVATIQQAETCLEAGARRILMANQLVGAAEIQRAVRLGEQAEFYCLVDSAEGVALLPKGFRVLVELGVPGARAGCRTVEQGLAVARAAVAHGLLLCGVEGFEGMAPEPEVEAFLDRMAALFAACREAGLFGIDRPLLTAGGSTYYDRVLERLSGLGAHLVTRSGCYVTHDSGGYAESHRTMMARLGLDDGLRAALELWAYVQSRPDPDLAILTFGRRDCGQDSGNPIPLFRQRGLDRPQPVEGLIVERLSDQHAHMRVPPALDLKVGDRIGCGVSHPCTTIDKWRGLLLVDDGYRVIETLETCF